MYEYYAIEKQEIFCMLSMLRSFVLPSCQFLAAFFREFVQSPQSPTFIEKFLNIFCSVLKSTNFSWSSSTKPMFTTKPVTSNRHLLSSNACSVSEYVSKWNNQRSRPTINQVKLMTRAIHRLKKTISMTVSSSQNYLKC